MISPWWRRDLGAPVSASPLIVDLDGDGEVEIVVAADRVHAFRMDGTTVPGWPAPERGPFASTPAAADLDGDHRLEIVCGADDDRVYAWNARGRLLTGWPVKTGGDVYSSPVLVDLDRDGRPDILVGSDDGRLYALGADARPIRNWPVMLEGFVSCTAGVGDADADGAAEIAAGSWDGKAWLLNADGRVLPGWPVEVGDLVWSSPVIADLDGDGRGEVIVVSNRVDVFDAAGRATPGWPRFLPGLAVSSPVVAAPCAEGEAVILVSDALRIWDRAGHPWPGTPAPLPAYAWATPAVSLVDGRLEVVIACLDGSCHQWTPADGLREVASGFGPLFSSPALVRTSRGWSVVLGSWDRTVSCLPLPEPHRVRVPVSHQFRGDPAHRTPMAPRDSGSTRDRPPAPPDPPPWRPARILGHAHPPVVAYQPTIVRIGISGGPPLRPRIVFVRGDGPPSPSPLLGHPATEWWGILPPADPGTIIRWHMEWTEPEGGIMRYPEKGEIETKVSRWRHALRLARGRTFP